MFRVFKITSTGKVPEGKGRDLFGLLIVQTDEGLFVVAPEEPLFSPRVLAKSNLVSVDGAPPLFQFKFNDFKQADWVLTCNQAVPPNLQNAIRLEGVWVSGPEQDEDSWTASGTGKGVPEDEDEARAASAY